MRRELTEGERNEFEEWLTSSSLSIHEPTDEMLIAFKVAKRLGRPATSVIRAARGQKGQGSLVQDVEATVQADADIEFWMDGRVRRTRFRTA